MDRYGPETYGERVADLYDDWYQDHPDTQVTVERLAELAGPGPVLELGVGTGRLALPLAKRGLEVHGIDASPAMLARLRAKPGSERTGPAPGAALAAQSGSRGRIQERCCHGRMASWQSSAVPSRSTPPPAGRWR